MSTLTEALEKFRTDLTEQVAEATRQAVEDGIRKGLNGKKVKRAAIPARVPASKEAKAKRAPKGRKRAKGEKRTPAEIAKIRDRILTLLRKKGPLNSEAIGKELNLTTSEIRLPIQHLWDQGLLEAEGLRRGMKYSVVDGA